MVFDPFGDFEARGYLQNLQGIKTDSLVKRAENFVFLENLPSAIRALESLSGNLEYRDVLDTHRRLFSDFYPWAGQDRCITSPNLRVGKNGVMDLFAYPEEIRRAAEYALEIGKDGNVMRLKPGEFLANVSYSHPFLDGNGRTILTIHSELCRRSGMHIDWDKTNKEDYLGALTKQMVDDSRRDLDNYLSPFVREGALSWDVSSRSIVSGLSLNRSSIESIIQSVRHAREILQSALPEEEREKSLEVIQEVSRRFTKGPSLTGIPLKLCLESFVLGKCEEKTLIDAIKAHEKAQVRHEGLFKGRSNARGHGLEIAF